MGTITKTKTWVDNDNVTYTDLNGNFDNVYNEFNGNIDNSNIKSSAAIDSTKIDGTAATLAGSETLTNKTITDATNNVMAKSLKSATTTVDVSAATAPTANQVLTATDSTHATWQTPAAVPAIVAGRGVGDGFGTSSTSYVDITGATVTIVVPVTSNVFFSFSGDHYNTVVTSNFNKFQLLRGSTVLMNQDVAIHTASAEHVVSMQDYDLSLAAGTYTYKVQMKVSGGSGTVNRGRLTVTAFKA